MTKTETVFLARNMQKPNVNENLKLIPTVVSDTFQKSQLTSVMYAMLVCNFNVSNSM